MGVYAALRRGNFLSQLLMTFSLIGVSSPVFWLAFIMLTIFYGWLQIAPGPGRLDPIDLPPDPVTGIFVVDSILMGDWEMLRSVSGFPP